MKNFYRTEEKTKKLKLKRFVKKQILPVIQTINIPMPFNFRFHILNESKFVGKSRGSSRYSKKRRCFSYRTRTFKKTFYSFGYKCGSFTFNKPQLIGKIITQGKNKYQIIEKL